MHYPDANTLPRDVAENSGGDVEKQQGGIVSLSPLDFRRVREPVLVGD